MSAMSQRAVVLLLCVVGLLDLSAAFKVGPASLCPSRSRLSLGARRPLRLCAVAKPTREERAATRSENKVKWARLRALVSADTALLCSASVFLFAAAVSEVAVPHFSSGALNAIVANAVRQPRP